MILKSLNIENFKCFKKADIDFGKITLLTGANSSGKSSLISVLLAMFQTENFPFYLSPNGNLINLGNYRNMVNGYDVNQNIRIDFSTEISPVGSMAIDWNFSTIWEKDSLNGLSALNKLEFSTVYTDNYNFSVEKIDKKFKVKSSKEVDALFESIDDIVFDLSFDKESIFSYEFSKDFSFNYIHSYRTNPQRNYLQIPKAGRIQPNGAGFENQIIEWEETNSSKLSELIEIMSKIGLLFDVKTNKIGDGMFVIKVQTKKRGVFSSLADVGYGVSKLLPIIVADLQLPNDSLLAISEPEIDLHPSVQANFANYLFEQTKKGKQYIVETHSEYIINRLRLLIAKDEMKEEDVKTYFFSNDGRNTTTYPINLKKDGQIENAPNDFFDTYEIDVMEIAMQG